MNTLRRMTFLIGIAFLVATTSVAQQQKRPPMSGPEAADDIAIRPFHINIPEEQIVDLRQRLAATRWPDKRRSMTNPRVFGWQRCRRWCATGATATICAALRRS
jgi:hypothetical protein